MKTEIVVCWKRSAGIEKLSVDTPESCLSNELHSRRLHPMSCVGCSSIVLTESTFPEGPPGPPAVRRQTAEEEVEAKAREVVLREQEESMRSTLAQR